LLNLVKSDKDLVLQIRNNYINIYYKGGNMLKVTHGPGFDFDHNYFKGEGIMDEQLQKEERRKMLSIIKEEHPVFRTNLLSKDCNTVNQVINY